MIQNLLIKLDFLTNKEKNSLRDVHPPLEIPEQFKCAMTVHAKTTDVFLSGREVSNRWGWISVFLFLVSSVLFISSLSENGISALVPVLFLALAAGAHYVERLLTSLRVANLMASRYWNGARLMQETLIEIGSFRYGVQEVHKLVKTTQAYGNLAVMIVEESDGHRRKLGMKDEAFYSGREHIAATEKAKLMNVIHGDAEFEAAQAFLADSFIGQQDMSALEKLNSIDDEEIDDEDSERERRGDLL